MNNPFDYIPDLRCEEAFSRLSTLLASLQGSSRPEDITLLRELADGKMLGVLIAEDSSGLSHTLYAFSGQLGEAGFHHPLFVEPVFDYLDHDGYFKTHERLISLQNKDIDSFEKGPLAKANAEYLQEQERRERELREHQQRFRQSKKARDAKRASGIITAEEQEDLIRQSQFEKAELKRIKKRLSSELLPYQSSLQETESHLVSIKERRREDSEALQKWLFDNFSALNAKGETRSLSEIFAATPLGVPPSGAGECCAPKLLQAAYRRGWHPIAMAERWYGKPKGGELRRDGEYYPACRGKCLPVLSWMLQGLEVNPPLSEESWEQGEYTPEVIYENEIFCVVNKPGGMLSVPGKGNRISLEQWLIKRYGPGRFLKMVHRLDQDTSGLIIAAFTPEAFKILQSLFATRRVSKQYIAVLEGDYRAAEIPYKGRISLPLAPDLLDRPRQRVDFEIGKEAVTDYEFADSAEGRSRVIFHPLTGRTHQLRVHAASEQGLRLPIVGDRLYGNRNSPTSRLHLHAAKIEFSFPLDGQKYHFESSSPF